jgi:hypothetical protein
MKTKFIISVLLAFIGLIACLPWQVNAQLKYDTLTNKTIISLTKIGLPPATIISKIKTSVTSFDVSVDALVNLQANGVNGDVINEMIKIDESSNTSVVKQINSSNPNVMHKSGIYYYNPKDTTNKLRRVDPSVTSGQSAGGASFYGIGGGSTISELAGANSKMQINDVSPVFYFYFENNANPNAESWFFATATSPKEFVLVKLNEKNKSRWIKTGSSTMIYGSVSNSKSGVPEKNKLDFDYVEISEGIYKVNFKEPLKSGEYCFMYASQTPSRYTNDKLFDFGIPNNK